MLRRLSRGCATWCTRHQARGGTQGPAGRVYVRGFMPAALVHLRRRGLEERAIQYGFRPRQHRIRDGKQLFTALPLALRPFFFVLLEKRLAVLLDPVVFHATSAPGTTCCCHAAVTAAIDRRRPS